MIACVSIIAKENNPLLLKVFPQTGDETKFHHICYCAIDVFEEKEQAMRSERERERERERGAKRQGRRQIKTPTEQQNNLLERGSKEIAAEQTMGDENHFDHKPFLCAFDFSATS